MSAPETKDNKVSENIPSPERNIIKAPTNTDNNRLGQTILDMTENNRTIPVPETKDNKVRKNIPAAGPDNLKALSKSSDDGVWQSTSDVHKSNGTYSSQECKKTGIEQENMGIPDGGFGWIVVLAISSPMIFIQNTSNFGILFSPPLLQMGASSSTIAGIYTIYATMWNLSGPFVGPLSQQLGWRTIGVGGYLLITISIISSAFVTKPFYLYITYAVLTVFSLTTDMILRKAFMVVFGYGTGIIITLHNLVMVEVMGLENLTSMVGVSCLVNAGAAFTIGPISGLIPDMSGSYTVSIQSVVGMVSLSFLLWLPLPVAKRLDRACTIRSQTIFIKDIEKSTQKFSGNEDISYEGENV